MDNVQEALGTFKGTKVLVTGHTGFKGTWLCIWLKILGAEIIGYSLDPPTQPNHFGACGIRDKITHIHGDILDYNLLLSLVERHRPEIVFHLAGQPIVRTSYIEPRLTYETNVIGSLNVLEAVRQSDTVRAVVVVTSEKCYENKGWLWGYRENEPLGGHDPYSSSKACLEVMVASWQRSFFPAELYAEHGVSLATARPSNVIGGGDWAKDRLVPDCVQALAAGRPIMVRNPTHIRPWQYVVEVLFGYLLLAAHLWKDGPHYNGAWNFGQHEYALWSVEEVVQAVIHFWGSGNYMINRNGSKLYEDLALRMDCTKAMKVLNWHPIYGVHRTLEATVSWYKAFYEMAESDTVWNYSVKQIKAYTEELLNKEYATQAYRVNRKSGTNPGRKWP